MTSSDIWAGIRLMAGKNEAKLLDAEVEQLPVGNIVKCGRGMVVPSLTICQNAPVLVHQHFVEVKNKKHTRRFFTLHTNTHDQFGALLLCFAVVSDQFRMIFLLLKTGSEMTENKKNKKALHYESGDVLLARLLGRMCVCVCVCVFLRFWSGSSCLVFIFAARPRLRTMPTKRRYRIRLLGNDGARPGLQHAPAQYPGRLLRTILLQSIPGSITLEALNPIYFLYKLLEGPYSAPSKIALRPRRNVQIDHARSSTKTIPHVKKKASSSNNMPKAACMYGALAKSLRLLGMQPGFSPAGTPKTPNVQKWRQFHDRIREIHSRLHVQSTPDSTPDATCYKIPFGGMPSTPRKLYHALSSCARTCLTFRFLRPRMSNSSTSRHKPDLQLMPHPDRTPNPQPFPLRSWQLRQLVLLRTVHAWMQHATSMQMRKFKLPATLK